MPPRVEQEVLFVLATRDTALKKEMAGRMVEGGEGVVGRLRRREVNGGHWVLWERPEEVNAAVREWVDEVVFGGMKDGEGQKVAGSKL